MSIKLTHPFLRRCLDKDEILSNVDKFNSFASKLEKQAETYAELYAEIPEDEEDEEKIEEAMDKAKNTYKGWGFELFVEFLIKSHPLDKRIGISDYRIGEEDDDRGVDGSGIGINGKPATVQAKYRQANYELTANGDHLSNFVVDSQNRFGVSIEDKSNMLIITAGKDLNYKTEQDMLHGKVRCLNREKIRIMVDENISFWNAFRESWINSLPKKKPN